MSPKIKMETFAFDEISPCQLHLGSNYKIYLSFVQHISLSCPYYHQEIDTKNSADRCKNHIVSCFSKPGEFYKHFVEIDWIWCNDKASTKSCEMITSTLKYLVVCVISNLNRKKSTIKKCIRSAAHTTYRTFNYQLNIP